MASALRSAYVEVLLQPHNALIEAEVAAHGGRVYQPTGDGFVLVFGRAQDALACAEAVQKRLADERRSHRLAAEDRDGNVWEIQVRMGLHTSRGEMQATASGGQRTYDRPEEINFAARLESLADGGQVIVSQTTFEATDEGAGYRWQQWPNRYLKSFEGAPETVYELLYDGWASREPGSRWLPEWYVRELNPFVGREALLGAIRDWLADSRPYPIFTLHGFGGIGKTRLAVETVLGVSGLFPGGVAFVALDRVLSGDPAQVTPAQLAALVAGSVGAPESVLQRPESELLPHLKRQKSLLLVLDNWESAANPATLKWLGDLLKSAGSLRCLVTSRLVMGIQPFGDSREIPGLRIPPGAADAFDAFEGYSLFLTRVRQRDPDYLPDDRAALVRVLQATGGSPLGIELVAARAIDYRGALPQLADEIEASRLDLLRTREDLGDVWLGPERHGSMDACIHWSVGLQPSDEQRAFHHLSVFPHDFSPASAQFVCDIPEAYLLRWHRAALVEQSPTGGKMRYTLLPIVREYANRRIDAEDARGARRRFVARCLQIVEDNRNLNDAKARSMLTEEWRNIVAAAEMAEELGDRQSVRRLSVLGKFLGLRGMWLEQERLYRRALANARKSGDRDGEGGALNNLGIVYRNQGKWSEAESVYQDSLAIKIDLGDRHAQGITLNNLGVVYQNQGKWSAAETVYQESARIFKELDDRYGEGMALGNLGIVYQNQGKWSEAEKVCQESLEICRALGDRYGEGIALNNLGSVYQNQGKWSEAEKAYQQDLEICGELGDRNGQGQTLRDLALLMEAQQKPAEALEYARAAVAALETTEDAALLARARDLVAKLSGGGTGP